MKAPGVDGKLLVDVYWEFKTNPVLFMKELVSGQYSPSPVKRVNIPKGNGKTRPLGIPTAKDRVMQKLIQLVLEPYLDPYFSPHSHGFRKKHSVYTAARDANQYIQSTSHAVVTDLSKFFDMVSHDLLMSTLRGICPDDRLCDLIERFLLS